MSQGSADPPAAGVLLVDKPPGVTSHDVVASVRRERGQKAGHAGTLDPSPPGCSIVLLGREATRCQSRFMELRKTYRVVARFGAVSTTGDPEGEITETGALPPDPLELPTGRIWQRPPAYSAVKVGGVRAYRLARRGEHVELPERQVTVHRFEQIKRTAERAEFEIECSAGHVRAEPGRRARGRVLREPAANRGRALLGRRGGRLPPACGCPGPTAGSWGVKGFPAARATAAEQPMVAATDPR